MRRATISHGRRSRHVGWTDAAHSRTRRRKDLRVCFQIPETGFDPAQMQDYYSNTIISHIFDAPLRYDFLARPVRLMPNMASPLPEVSTDFRTFTVRLTPGIFFQDDAAFQGQRRELIAADYVYSIRRVFGSRWKSQVLFILKAAKIAGIDQVRQRALKDKQPFDYAREIEGLRMLDRYTFQIRLEQLNPRFVYILALANPVGAVAREVVNIYGDQIAAHPVGTGRFVWRTGYERLAPFSNATPPIAKRFTISRRRPVRRCWRAMSSDCAGKLVPLVDRVKVTIIQEAQPRWPTIEQSRLDHLLVPAIYGTLIAPNGSLPRASRVVECGSISR